MAKHFVPNLFAEIDDGSLWFALSAPQSTSSRHDRGSVRFYTEKMRSGWVNGLTVMTGKSQSQSTTSRTISISLALQAHPLSRMSGRGGMLTKHIPPAVNSSKGSCNGQPLMHLTARLQSSQHLPRGYVSPSSTRWVTCCSINYDLSYSQLSGAAPVAGWGATCRRSASGDIWIDHT